MIAATKEAGLDLSDPAFDVVRSIRVHHIQYAQRVTSGGGAGEACRRQDGSRVGGYGADGSFRWEEATAGLVPSGPGFSAFDPPAELPLVPLPLGGGELDRRHRAHTGFEEVRY